MRNLVEWKCGYEQFRRGVYERAADSDTSTRSIDCTRSIRIQWILLGGHVGAGNMNGKRRALILTSPYICIRIHTVLLLDT
jgi:hypothetical protein